MKDSEITNPEPSSIERTADATAMRKILWEQVQGRRPSYRWQKDFLPFLIAPMAIGTWMMGQRGGAVLMAIVMVIFFVGSVADRIRLQIGALAELVSDLEQSKSWSSPVGFRDR